MGRLIDADRLKQVLDKNFGNIGAANVMMQLIDNQPTAFDVDKVVEQLKKEFKKYYGDNWDKAPYLVKAIEIVKGGGRG